MSNKTQGGFVVQEGDIIGTYKLLKPIKSGEQGHVWLACFKDNENIQYALKIGVRPVNGERDRQYKKFIAEFNMLAALNHPNIVKVHHGGIHKWRGKQYPFYVMDYLGEDSKDLGAYIASSKAGVSSAVILIALFETALALEYLHHHDGCHRDIKASNILLCGLEANNVTVKLIDFGFALFATEHEIHDKHETDSGPKKRTSLRRRAEEGITHQQNDVWQLAYTFSKILHEKIDINGDKVKRNWPIDHACYDSLLELLRSWASEAPDGVVTSDAGKVFYGELRKYTATVQAQLIDQELRGAIRYFAVPEIAAAGNITQAEHTIKIPPRVLVQYSDRISKIIATPEFTALGYTRQLGFTHLVYPGATGTRLEHALGVYHLATRVIMRFVGQPLFRKHFSDPREIELFLVASLLHDVGHYPYAHQLEEFSPGEFDSPSQISDLVRGHHQRTRAIIEGRQSMLNAVLRSRDGFGFSSREISRITALIDDEKRKSTDRSEIESWAPPLQFLSSILNGPFDIDKLDYIERDALHCGVPYGCYVDVDKILETIRIQEKEGKLRLIFDPRGVGCLEQLITARHQMYANVYWHRAVRAATSMFKHMFCICVKLFGERISKIFYKARSDDRLLQMLEIELEGIVRPSSEVKAAIYLLKALTGENQVTRRNLYKAIVQVPNIAANIARYGGYSREGQRGKAKKVYDYLASNGFWDTDKFNDSLSYGINNVIIDCHKDYWPPFEKIMIEKGNDAESIVRRAPSVGSLKSNFHEQACLIRVFININALKPGYRSKSGRQEVCAAIEKAEI